MRELGEMSDRRARLMFQVIGDMRSQLEAQIRDAVIGADVWELQHLERVRAGFDALSRRTADRLAAEMAEHGSRAARVGFGMQPEALKRAGISIGFGEPDVRQVDLATGLSADLIRSISAQARADINQAMLRSVIAQDRPAETLRAISNILSTQPDRVTGKMGSLPMQAERIMRTEGLTIANLANYTQMTDTASRFRGAMKVWIHGGGGRNPRPYHRDVLNGQVIPMDKDFVVRDGNHVTKAFGPQAPNLPAASRINCTCTLGLVLPDFGSWTTSVLRAKATQAKLRAAWGET